MQQPKTPLPGPLFDAVSLFERLGIAYALAGGIAAMYYGRARFTDDLDFVAAANHEAVMQFHPIVSLHHDPFADDIANCAVVAHVGGRAVRIAEVHDLVAMKLRAARPQDDYDVSEIIRSGSIDETILASRVTLDQLGRYRDLKRRTT